MSKKRPFKIWSHNEELKKSVMAASIEDIKCLGFLFISIRKYLFNTMDKISISIQCTYTGLETLTPP